METLDPDDLTVGIELRCNGGDNLVQPANLPITNGVHFNVTNFEEGVTDCEVVEVSGRDDYFPIYIPGTGDNPPSSGDEFIVLDEFDDWPFDDYTTSCELEDITSGEYTCTIYNAPEPADFTINKNWEIFGSEDTQDIESDYTLGLICFGAWQLESDDGSFVINEAISLLPISFKIWGGQDAEDEEYESEVISWFNIEGDFEVDKDVIGSACVVLEETFDSRVEITGDCPMELELEGGLEDILINGYTVLPGTSHECEVVNTVFFEGIPDAEPIRHGIDGPADAGRWLRRHAAYRLIRKP